ncbi:hypothetical protein OCH239_05180 [Roseivivax halodurans JCM 10272]|uniref:SD-repeat containing protein B domain-containing protein n=1 Tax=Roseivivax halodurans JCM 10272 TaxID=1449350 RepID=X7EG03_9RHOB|nr:SdrD B-like domain-containing protein [Roseivivax halodurans]ETX14033.1 hypothetical protein OCH239_05180 [Roseivivax halodurans JCM 10272]
MTYYSYQNYYRTYEWTAFRESDLLKSGDRDLGYGDCFTMPASSTVCLATVDNDGTLSGDTYCDENADDRTGQNAWVDGERVGGQLYAESYHVLKGADGKIYYLIEIEIEGTHDDYFSFYGDVPPAGLKLTLVQTCAVNGDWVDYKCLDAGPKEPPVEYGSVSGTVWCDDCDGIQDYEITYAKGADVWCDSVTYESVTCTTYNVCDYGSWKSTAAQVIDIVVGRDQGHNGNAYDNTIVELDKGGVWTRDFYLGEGGKFCLTFDTYKNFCVDDEGNTFGVKVNGVYVQTVVVTADGKVEISLDLAKGYNKIEFVSKSDVTGFGAGIDNTELVKLKEVSTFAEMPKAGVTVKLIDAATGDVVAETVTDADGNYRFDDVPVGDYKIMGVAPDGTEFTIQNAGSDDSVDSDVDKNGLSDTFTVKKDQNTDIDLGLCEKDAEPGSLSGRYFCDTNDNDQDDGNGGEPAVPGVRVALFDAAGNAAVDIDGNAVAPVFTDSNGNYSFTNLAAGFYTVKFTDPNGVLAGKQLVTANVGNDASDSDAIGDTTLSVIAAIEVKEGENTPDNDAGVEYVNEDPTATDDAGKGCADELIFVDFSDNFADSDSASVGITQIGGIDIADGETVVVGGVNVTLNGGVFSFDGEAAYEYLDFGQKANQTFTVTVEDSDGGSATAEIDVSFCGVAETVEQLNATIPAGPFSFQIADDFQDAPAGEDAYTLVINGTGDARLDGVAFEEAYCISFWDNYEAGETVADAPVVTGASMTTGTDGSVFDDIPNEQVASAVNGLSAAENLDMVNWILAQDFGSAGYSEWEIQFAIWDLTDNWDPSSVGSSNAAVGLNNSYENGRISVAMLDSPFFSPTFAAEVDQSDVDFILNEALANGEGFEFGGAGDTSGLASFIVTGDPEDAANQQPFIFTVPLGEFDCLCG